MQVNPKTPNVPQKSALETPKKGASQNEASENRVQLGKKKMPPDPAINNIMRADKHNATMTLRKSYGMVISSYENVARKDQLSSDAAEQLGRTVSSRIKELNRESQRKIEDLPEYKNLGLKDIRELGEEISDRITEKDEYLQAFALMKHPVFADLMESTETAHRSFSEMMEANGEEHLMFGVFEMIKNMGGLARSQESTQVAQGNNKLNIRV
jgi:archaellum component FlaC